MLLTLNRPDRLNAWNDELEARCFDLLDEAEDDAGIRAIVVTGAGRGFCAGAGSGQRRAARRRRPAGHPAGTPVSYPATLRKPLVAAINGPAAGLGLVEALYCDVRFCTPQAKLTTAFSLVGRSPRPSAGDGRAQGGGARPRAVESLPPAPGVGPGPDERRVRAAGRDPGPQPDRLRGLQLLGARHREQPDTAVSNGATALPAALAG